MKVNGAVIAQMAEDFATYQKHPDLGFACCSAHAVADHVPALLAEVQRLRTSRWDATEIVARLESGLLETQTELSRAQARIAELEARDTPTWRERAEKAEARVAELEPDVAAKRAEIRDSYTALIAQAEQDGDYAGAYDAWRLLQDREEKWKREDATTKPNPTAEEAS